MWQRGGGCSLSPGPIHSDGIAWDAHAKGLGSILLEITFFLLLLHNKSQLWTFFLSFPLSFCHFVFVSHISNFELHTLKCWPKPIQSLGSILLEITFFLFVLHNRSQLWTFSLSFSLCFCHLVFVSHMLQFWVTYLERRGAFALFSESPISEITMHKKYNDVTNVAMLYSKMSVNMSTFICQKSKLVCCYSEKWHVFKCSLDLWDQSFFANVYSTFKVYNSELEHVTDKHKIAKT